MIKEIRMIINYQQASTYSCKNNRSF